MENFIAFNPTVLHFGKNVVNEMAEAAGSLGRHALLLYGGGSVLRNGSHADTSAQLRKAGIKITEFGGIKPNPLVDDVEAAIRLGKEKGVDMVVAVGGGSVIDSAKVITVCIAENCDPWKFMKGRHKPDTALPLIAVLTLAATGTEMNNAAVVQNSSTREKIGLKHDLMYPDLSFLDPTYTLSVPGDYTAYGIVDLVAHSLEAWFGEGDAPLSDRFVISIIQEALDYGPRLMEDLGNYALRERIMWAATCALNNMTHYGRKSPDWGVHALGHVLSFLYDTPHGASLSIVYPAWMRALSERAGNRISQLGEALFGTGDVEQSIRSFEAFFTGLGSPVRCQDGGIEASCKPEILSLMNENRAEGLHHLLSDADRERILSFMW
jgi:alcohol dehydrogenase YqhD (iron-dependent ADH family)